MTTSTRTGSRPHAKTLSNFPRDNDLFDFARDQENLARLAVRRLARRLRVSPTMAALIAELSGLSNGGRND